MESGVVLPELSAGIYVIVDAVRVLAVSLHVVVFLHALGEVLDMVGGGVCVGPQSPPDGSVVGRLQPALPLRHGVPRAQQVQPVGELVQPDILRVPAVRRVAVVQQILLTYRADRSVVGGAEAARPRVPGRPQAAVFGDLRGALAAANHSHPAAPPTVAVAHRAHVGEQEAQDVAGAAQGGVRHAGGAEHGDAVGLGVALVEVGEAQLTTDAARHGADHLTAVARRGQILQRSPDLWGEQGTGDR